MAKVLLDVGAHVGETLEVALEPRWGFDQIYSFEPAPQCWPALQRFASPLVEILPYGLWREDDMLELFDAGDIGASLFSDKSTSGVGQPVELRDAVTWFRDHVRAEDTVIMKVNCEGAEHGLLSHLISSGELSKVDALVVHFDARKIRGMEHLADDLHTLLTTAGIPFIDADQIFFGRNTQEKTRNYLRWYHAAPPLRLWWAYGRRLEFAVRTAIYRRRNGQSGFGE